MASTGAVMRDVTRALLVLALVFLNFAHVPAGERTAYDAALTAYLLPATAIVLDCGESHEDDHVPCHACRIGGAAELPPTPCASTTLPIASSADYLALADNLSPTRQRPRATPRAPPFA
jgi:hypothetical protein